MNTSSIRVDLKVIKTHGADNVGEMSLGRIGDR